MNIKKWIASSFLSGDTEKYPFSFIYGGVASRELLRQWQTESKTQKLDQNRIQHVITCRDPETPLEIECEVTEYADFQAAEWVLRFRNAGTVDTPILEQIQSLDTAFTRQKEEEFVLHCIRGCLYSKSEFAPLHYPLGHHGGRRISSVGGRSSSGSDITRDDGVFPFFDLTFDEAGLTFAVGWTGQWAADLRRDGQQGITVSAGMERTHLRLHPGEEIRSPRILIVAWNGDLVDGHNQFRRFMLKHHTPQRDGQPVLGPLSANTWFRHRWGNDVNEENQIQAIREIVENKIELDCFWIDAGWYEGVGNWAFDVGNWFPKKKAFPRGLKPVVDEAKKHGLGFVLWFEPERVHPDTWLWDNHPEWLIMPDAEITRKRQPFIDKVEAVLNLGNSEARRWLTDHVSSIIEEAGITVYRQDFNFDPLDYWRSADAPDRQGMTEIRHIEGLYAFWDELRRRHPGLLIDNCATGHRRCDLETVSRAVNLWRADYAFEPEGVQCHTLGFTQYVVSAGVGVDSSDPYIFRSNLAGSMTLTWHDPQAKKYDYAELRKRVAEFKMLRPLFYGDFYPLLSHNVESDAWCVYQLDRPDLNFGAVLAFRRKASPFPVGTFKLRGLRAELAYEFKDIDTEKTLKCTGADVMEKGLRIEMTDAPHAMIITYRQV